MHNQLNRFMHNQPNHLFTFILIIVSRISWIILCIRLIIQCKISLIMLSA